MFFYQNQSRSFCTLAFAFSSNDFFLLFLLGFPLCKLFFAFLRFIHLYDLRKKQTGEIAQNIFGNICPIKQKSTAAIIRAS